MLLTAPPRLKPNKIKENLNNRVKFFSIKNEETGRKGPFDPLPVKNPRGLSLPGRLHWLSPPQLGCSPISHLMMMIPI